MLGNTALLRLKPELFICVLSSTRLKIPKYKKKMAGVNIQANQVKPK